MPRPEPALAAFNRGKRKLAISLYRARENNGALTSLPVLDDMLSGYKATTVIDLCDDIAYATPDRVDVSLLMFLYGNF